MVELFKIPEIVTAARKTRTLRCAGGSGTAHSIRYPSRQIILLLGGVFAVVLLHREAGYMEDAGDAAAVLIRSAI